MATVPRWLFITVIVVVVAFVGVGAYLALRPPPVRLKTAEELSKMERKPMPPPPRIPGM